MVLHEERVARDDYVRRGRLAREAASDVPHVALVHIDLQGRCELRELVTPVREKRERRNDKHRPPFAASVSTLRQDPRYRLYRLSEAHVVREQRAESAHGEAAHPLDSAQLVVAQLARETVRNARLAGVQRARYRAEVRDEHSERSARIDLLDLHARDRADSERERQRIRLGLLDLLERAQRLAQKAAVDLYPSVAEEHERRLLLEEEAYLLSGDLLAVDLYLEAHGRGGLPVRRVPHLRRGGDARLLGDALY